MSSSILSGTIARSGDSPLQSRSHYYRGVYGRLFPNLPPWEPAGKSEEERLSFLARTARSLRSLEVEGDPAKYENCEIPAGYTYLGQFITHDLTFDATSSLEEKNEPIRLSNLRTPRFDLDCVYGRGPGDQPYLYDPFDGRKLLIGLTDDDELDLPRNQGLTAAMKRSAPKGGRGPRRAIIGDPRNDENVIISQLHLAFLRLHNAFVDEGWSFAESRQLVRWHYQWVVLHDYLPSLCDKKLVADLIEHKFPAVFRTSTCPFVPVEFSVAAFRFGHSTVRTSYHLNEELTERMGGPLRIFGASPDNTLVGGRDLPKGWSVQWDLFAGKGRRAKGKTQASMKIDENLAAPLATLPLDPGDRPTFDHASLAFRTLLRGWRMALPSGQAVAQRLSLKPLPRRDGNDDPLWLYILREAAEAHDGKKLGPVGERLVAEVIVGLMHNDPTCFLTVNPEWRPVPKRKTFGLFDLLEKAAASG